MKNRQLLRDATDYRREAYEVCNMALHADWPCDRMLRDEADQLANHADLLESAEPAAHQPAGFIKLYPTQ